MHSSDFCKLTEFSWFTKFIHTTREGTPLYCFPKHLSTLEFAGTTSKWEYFGSSDEISSQGSASVALFWSWGLVCCSLSICLQRMISPVYWRCSGALCFARVFWIQDHCWDYVSTLWVMDSRWIRWKKTVAYITLLWEWSRVHLPYSWWYNILLVFLPVSTAAGACLGQQQPKVGSLHFRIW